MGLIRKTLSICTLGLIRWRSNREKLAHAALMSARAERDRVALQARQAEVYNRGQWPPPPATP